MPVARVQIPYGVLGSPLGSFVVVLTAAASITSGCSPMGRSSSRFSAECGLSVRQAAGLRLEVSSELGNARFRGGEERGLVAARVVLDDLDRISDRR